jgi:hypothetical protein
LKFKDNVIEQVSDGGVTEAQLLRHYFKATAAFYELNYEILFAGGEACKKG